MFRLYLGGASVQCRGKNGKNFSVSVSSSEIGVERAQRRGEKFTISEKATGNTVSVGKCAKPSLQEAPSGKTHGNAFAYGHGNGKTHGNAFAYGHGNGKPHGNAFAYGHGNGKPHGNAFAYGHGNGKDHVRGYGWGRRHGNSGGGSVFADADDSHSDEVRIEEIIDRISRADSPPDYEGSPARGYMDVITVGDGETLGAEIIASSGFEGAYAGTVNVISGGVISGTVADQGGTINIGNGATGSDLEVRGANPGPAYLNVLQGGVVRGFTLTNSNYRWGTQITVAEGGEASGGAVSRGRMVNYGWASGIAILDSGSIFNDGIVSGGFTSGGETQASIGGTFYDHTVYGGGVHARGGTFSGTVMSGGNLYVSNGGGACDTTVFSGTAVYVSSGGSANDTFISGGAMTVFAGGAASGGYVRSGMVYVASDGTLSGFSVSDAVSGGALQLQINSGGFAQDITIDRGNGYYPNVYVYGVLSNLIGVNGLIRTQNGGLVSGGGLSAGELWAYSGAVVEDVAITGGGGYALSGGVFRNITVSGGNVHMRGGELSGAVLQRGTINTLNAGSSGGIVSDVIMENGYVNVSGGSAVRTTVSGGWLLVYDAGVADTIDMFGGSTIVYSGGVASNIAMSGGALIVSSAGSALITDDMEDGGILVNYGGELTVSGAAAGNITMNATGNIFASGAVISDLTLGAGYLDTFENTIVSGLDVTGYAMVHCSGTTELRGVTLNSGYIWLMDSATADGVTVDSGGRLNLWHSTAAASNVTVLSGGTAFANAAASAYNYDVRSGAELRVDNSTSGGANFIWCGTGTYIEEGVIAACGENFQAVAGEFRNLALSGDTLRIGDGATVVGGTVSSGGRLYLYSGGTASGTVLDSGGTGVILDGGVGSDIRMQGGSGNFANLHVTGGGTVNGLSVRTEGNPTCVFVSSGGTVNDLQVTGNGGNIYIYAGGVMNDIENNGAYLRNYGTISGGRVTSGELWALPGGVIDGCTAATSTGRIYAVSGGTVGNTTLSGGELNLRGGAAFNITMADGTINTTQVYNGVEQTGGGTVTGVTMSGGILNIRSGTATGITATGGTINVLSGGSAVFDSVSGSNTAIVIDYSDGGTDTRIASLATVSSEVCISVAGMTAGNTYVLAETDNPDLVIRVIDGMYSTELAVGESYTNAASGLTYTRNGAVVTVGSFTAGIADVTGEIELIAENLINGDEYARRWTGNTTSGGKTAILVLSGTSVPGAVWLDLDGFDAQAEPVNVFGTEGDCMADGTVNIAAKSGKFLNIAGGATRGGTVGTVNFTLAGAAITGSAFVGGMGNADTVNTLIASGAVEKDFFAGVMANRPVVPTMVGEVNLTVEGGDFGNNLYGGSLVRTEGHTDGIVHSVCEINVTLSGVDSVGDGFSFYAGGMAAGHDDRGDLRANVYEVGFINLTITGGDYGTAAGGRGIFGGIFVGDNQSGGTWGTQAEVTGKEGDDRSAVTINVTGGTIGNLYGGGWAQKGGTSIVASVNITVDGGTIANVFGGGCHSTSPGSDGVSKSLVTGNVNITIGNYGSVTGNIFARGYLREDVVTGISTVTITGRAARSCNIYGYDCVDFTVGSRNGISHLVLSDNSGTFTGNIGGFERITFSGNTAATFAAEDISAGADGFIENSAWVFDLTGRSDILSSDALLDWSHGTFAGDTVDVKFADDVQARGGWSIANVSTASGATFNLEIGGLSISDLGYGDRITAAQSELYAGWGFTLDDGTLKFANLG